MVTKTTFKQYLLEAKIEISPAETSKELLASIVDGKFTKDGSKLEIYDNFVCSALGMKSLKGSPEIINGDFYCINNQLKTLAGGPKIVRGLFNCDSNELTSLIGAPQIIKKEFSCDSNKLKSLKGSPRIINGDFYCRNNKLKYLIDGPEVVNGNFTCSKNNLISLLGAPKIIKGHFYSSHNSFTSLKAINLYIHEIDGWAYFNDCEIKSNILGLLKIKGLRRVTLNNEKISDIMNKYLPEGNISECMDELIDNGFGEYAKW